MQPNELFSIEGSKTSDAQDKASRAEMAVKRLSPDGELYEARAHDIKNALRAFDTFISSVKNGYRLDDANAPLYIARLEEALGDLRVEARFWQALYDGGT